MSDMQSESGKQDRVSFKSHLTRFLGPIDRSIGAEVTGSSFGILRAGGAGFRECVSYSTDGLRHSQLTASAGTTGTTVRLELFMLGRFALGPEILPSLLVWAGEQLLRFGNAPPVGAVLPVGDEIWPGSLKTHIGFLTPVYLPESFRLYRSPSSDCFMVWVVPLCESEARVVKAHGWAALEGIFLAEDPDLLDPLRPCSSLRSIPGHEVDGCAQCGGPL